MARLARVYITGIGVCTGVGTGTEDFFEGCLRGPAKVEPIPEAWRLFHEPQSRSWTRLPEPDFLSIGLRRADQLLLAKPALMGLLCAHQALLHAEFSATQMLPTLPPAHLDPRRFGVLIGTGLGAAQAPFDNYLAHIAGPLQEALRAMVDDADAPTAAAELLAQLKRHPRVNPMVICQTMPNAIAANIALRVGAQGPCRTVASACASGTVAIAEAFNALRYGHLDAVLAGGVEHLGDATGSVFMGFDRLQTLARPRVSGGGENRPFDAERSGFLFSEGGAAVLLLETESSMARRGATPVAEILGCAETCDAHSIAAISPTANSITEMFDRALLDAGLDARQIDYVNAHGTGTEVNDRVEAQIISRVFPHGPYVNSTKSLLGHTIGAAGAIECAVTALSLSRQELHASANLEHPIADLSFCTRSGPAALEHALTHSFGFGGHNAALVLRRVN